ncbi:hypothetical protein AncyloWKF20_05840 [Ancylobacter sp. WKF20]|uniref:hypothetical protein n=1 Tax=Ancylobacter sp. WKF20 TaxID=3039801 RepID=UPI0024341374|nr:hypothetical protein [Ancylobacter sp. WKF20]WGD31346.1 hypothetical protein AncyloWKF20_05840 [Ancylobacter sp. WKF20]
MSGPALAQTPEVEAAAPPPPPLVLLLDGLGVYVESDYIGVSALAGPLQRQGFRTRTDSHLMTRTQGIVPDIIIGHSMGGDTALRYARKLIAAGQPAPVIITIDAAPAPPSCPVPRCINIHGPGFADVRGAVNVDAWASGARFVSHAQLPTAPVVQQMILGQTQSFMTERRTVATRSAPGATTGRGARTPAAPAQGAGEATTTDARPRMWTSPAWTIPGWTSPSTP